MKNLLTLISTSVLLLTGCVSDTLLSVEDAENAETTARNDSQGDGLFYYNFDEKVYLSEKKDQIFVKFTADATEGQYRSIAENYKISTNNGIHFSQGWNFNTLILETPQSIDAINSLKVKQEIASVEYLLEYDGHLSAITDEFLVKTKEGTSHAQLHELAQANKCTVSEREWFGGGVAFVITVSKSSELNAIGMANLFYETGLFESAAPNFYHFNAFSSIGLFIPATPAA